jgi:hypothetical protein
MLPTEIEGLIRERIDVYLKSAGFRPPTFGQRVLAKSMAVGVIQPYKLGGALIEEVQAASNGIFEAIKVVILKVGVAPYKELQTDLLTEFDFAFDECTAHIRKLWSDRIAESSGNRVVAVSSFELTLKNVKAARHSDLKLVLAELSQTQQREAGESDRRTFNIHRFTGVLGDVTNSVVNVYDYNSIRSELKQLNIPRSERSELEDILDELKTDPPATTKQSLIEKGKAWIVKISNFWAPVRALSDKRSAFQTLHSIS